MTTATSSIGSDSTMYYVYMCECPFAITTAGLTEDEEEKLADDCYTAAGNRPAAYTCKREEIPAEYMVYEGQALKDYFNL